MNLSDTIHCNKDKHCEPFRHNPLQQRQALWTFQTQSATTKTNIVNLSDTIHYYKHKHCEPFRHNPLQIFSSKPSLLLYRRCHQQCSSNQSFIHTLTHPHSHRAQAPAHSSHPHAQVPPPLPSYSFTLILMHLHAHSHQ